MNKMTPGQKMMAAARESGINVDDPYDVLGPLIRAQAEAVDRVEDATERIEAAAGRTAQIDPAALKRIEDVAVRGTDRRVAELVRTHTARTILSAAGVGLVAALLLAGGAYWLGLHQGEARGIEAASDVRQLLRDDYPAAVAWLGLIRFNGTAIVGALANCKPVPTVTDQPACEVAVWTGPKPAPQARR
jgi:hypothetical protein